MKVLLISANTEKLVEISLPLGLGLVAAATRRAGHEVAFLDMMTQPDGSRAVRDTLETLRPDLVGISVRNIDDQEMRSTRFLLEPIRTLIRELRQFSAAPVVLGGAGYSIYPESALAYLGAEMGIQGEGEIAFPLLLDRIQKGLPLSGTPGLILAGAGFQGERALAKSLDAFSLGDDLPGLASSLQKEDLWFPYQTRRGCPMDCSYCSTAAVEGRRLRRRSPALVTQEIARLADQGIRRIHFVDNTFNVPDSYAKELCAGLASIRAGLSWRCILYPWRIDEGLVRGMAGAGCVEVTLGFESGCERILRGMNKRYRPEEVRETSRLLQDYGLRRLGMLLLGAPGETMASVEETLAFADSLNCELVAVTAGIRIYPNTLLADIARAEGVIQPQDDLLLPRFYLARGLEGRLAETLRAWASERPNWLL
jgi:radical SAM superfamily enzyme YgiQ (UPF0313 family)